MNDNPTDVEILELEAFLAYIDWYEEEDDVDMFLSDFADIEPPPMYTNNVIDFQAYKDARK